MKRISPACIIYTSGTGGNPKGVILSHGGILSNCEGAYELLKTIKSPDLTFLTWLPLSHSYEHAVQFVQIILEAKVYKGNELFEKHKVSLINHNIIDKNDEILYFY